MPAETTPLLLKSNLKQLKLPTMLGEWEKLAREAASNNEAMVWDRETSPQIAARSCRK